MLNPKFEPSPFNWDLAARQGLAEELHLHYLRHISKTHASKKVWLSVESLQIANLRKYSLGLATLFHGCGEGKFMFL